MFIVKCILTEAFSPVNNFLMFIINFYMFYNKFYTFYNKARTNCNPWHPIPSPTKKLLPCDLTVAKAAAFLFYIKSLLTLQLFDGCIHKVFGTEFCIVDAGYICLAHIIVIVEVDRYCSPGIHEHIFCLM